MKPFNSKSLVYGLLLILVALPLHAAEKTDFLSRYFDSLKTFSAEFAQQVISEHGESLQSARGRMWISRPGKFRWDYAEPYQQMLLGDGRRLWSYDPELEQAIVKPLDEVLNATPAMLLSGNADPDKLFRTVAQGKEGRGTWFEMVPRDSKDEISKVVMMFTDGELSDLEFIDRLGQRTKVRFTSVSRNGRLDAGLFKFTPPPEVDVLGDF